jgi:hypothetical protein
MTDNKPAADKVVHDYFDTVEEPRYIVWDDEDGETEAEERDGGSRTKATK